MSYYALTTQIQFQMSRFQRFQHLNVTSISSVNTKINYCGSRGQEKNLQNNPVSFFGVAEEQIRKRLGDISTSPGVLLVDLKK